MVEGLLSTGPTPSSLVVSLHNLRKRKKKKKKSCILATKNLLTDANRGRVHTKKIRNVNFFQKGGGSTPKFTFKKSLNTVKRAFKMDFLYTRMCFGMF